MSPLDKQIVILLADDDDDDFMLLSDAFEEFNVRNTLRHLKDGVELMDYLHHRGSYHEPKSSPEPGLILLDLNLPRKDGREVLEELRADENLCNIPVVVLASNKTEEDVIRGYNLGLETFLGKPPDFSQLLDVLKDLPGFGVQIVHGG